jgi:hypothetical protein
MAIFPRPVSPRSAASDFWSYFRQQRPHKWPLLGVSAALTWVIIWAFLADSKTNTMPTRNKIIYFESWDANRSDAQIILQQKIDLAKGEAALAKQQEKMRAWAGAFGIEWREEAARNGAKRKEVLTRVNADLDKRLAQAEAEEKAKPGPATAEVAKP